MHSLFTNGSKEVETATRQLCNYSRSAALGIVCLITATVLAADFSLPQQVTAGTTVNIATSGSGDAVLYLIGPATRLKRQVGLGKPVTLDGRQLREAGRYIAILRDNAGETVKTLFVTAAPPGNLSFFAQPSRVPSAKPGVISGTVFVFDEFQNLVLAPTPVRFDVSLAGMPSISRTLTTRDGVAWTRMDSGRKEGPAQFIASTGDASVRRVVQQVAAEPCNLRIKAQPSKNGIVVETDPVRDCSGNTVPDGSIVTFTQIDESGKSTVDARIKRGIARAELPSSPRATITVAAGVVVGNEIRWGGGR